MERQKAQATVETRRQKRTTPPLLRRKKRGRLLFEVLTSSTSRPRRNSKASFPLLLSRKADTAWVIILTGCEEELPACSHLGLELKANPHLHHPRLQIPIPRKTTTQSSFKRSPPEKCQQRRKRNHKWCGAKSRCKMNRAKLKTLSRIRAPNRRQSRVKLIETRGIRWTMLI